MNFFDAEIITYFNQFSQHSWLFDKIIVVLTGSHLLNGGILENMNILQATIDDAEEILQIQKLAYQSEAELYGDYDIPPLKQTVEELRDQFKNHVILKAVSGAAIIGTVRAYEENGTCHIGRLAVNPGHQNRGVGTALMKVIEGCFNPQRFELFTGSKSVKNLHLYEKLGYTLYKKEKHGCGDIEPKSSGKRL